MSEEQQPHIDTDVKIAPQHGGLFHLAIRVWCVLRAPAVLAVLLWNRDAVVSFVEDRVGLGVPFHWLVYRLSTIGTRAALALIFLTALVVGCLLLCRIVRPGWRRTITWTALCFALAWITFGAFSIREPMPLILLSALTFLPGALPARLLNEVRSSERRSGRTALFFALLPGTEGMLRPFLLWFAGTVAGEPDDRSGSSRPRRMTELLLAALPPALVVAIMMPGLPLVEFELGINRHPSVNLAIRGNYNGIEVNSTGTDLLVMGGSQRRLRAYPLDNLATYRESQDTIGPNQAFGMNRADHLIYAYNRAEASLMVLTDPEMETVAEVPVGELARGDIWIAWDEATRSVVIASEANDVGPPAMVMVDIDGAGQIDSSLLDPGNILAHPESPLLYMSFFRRRKELIAYDMQRRAIVATAPADPRSDRMAIDLARGELLVASPIHGDVVVYGADSLQQRGRISAPFGVRSLAVDDSRDLLFAASFLTNQLDIIDLESRERLLRFRLGPWLRTIAVDQANAVAYVSSTMGIFEVRYGDELRRRGWEARSPGSRARF